MAVMAERDEVLFPVRTAAAAKLPVVYLEVQMRAAALARPTIPSENAFA
jgi:hypothetical protein